MVQPFVHFRQIDTPDGVPQEGGNLAYTKDDNQLYLLDADGTEHLVGGGSNAAPHTIDFTITSTGDLVVNLPEDAVQDETILVHWDGIELQNTEFSFDSGTGDLTITDPGWLVGDEGWVYYWSVAPSLVGPPGATGATGATGPAGAGFTYTPTYAQTGKNFSLARNNTSSGTFRAQTWTIAHHHWLKLTSFVCDIFSADTYDFRVDGEVVATVICGATSTGNTFAPASPIHLPPGPHVLQLRPTALRRFYYSSNTPVATGYTSKLLWSVWAESADDNFVPGVLNFDAEGS